jgi:predicted nuclease of predicted toxin-antitoxin system
VTILLDENFPLGLVRRLRADGLVAEHIITLGWRGASDARIRERLRSF